MPDTPPLTPVHTLDPRHADPDHPAVRNWTTHPAAAPEPSLFRIAPPPAPEAPEAPDTPVRHDGWTPDRQVRFLMAIADGHLVRDACAMVGLTVTAAYSFRRRAPGAAFALGWSAANLHARERLADMLLERAIDGQVETITRADGEVVQRHRHDNRLAQAMLARLDRLAVADAHATAPPADDAPHPAADPREAARTVAAGFEAYLDLIAADAGPARARLFVACAAETRATCTPALALADRWLDAAEPAPSAGRVQTATSTTSPAAAAARDQAPPDPANRAHWSATDWVRAEAAGLLHLTAAPAQDADAATEPPGNADDATPARVWRLSRDEWRTNFPPPPDFYGEEESTYGDPGYQRSLTRKEQEAADRFEAADPGRIAHAAARDAWFAGGGAPTADTGRACDGGAA